MQVIIFNQNGGVGVIIPAPNSGLTLEQTAKDVPQGASWRIVNSEDLPSYDARDRWRWTESGALDVAPYVPPPGPTPEQLAQEARAKRNTLLTASDWTQVPDAPVDRAAWATYRQALRDIPQQEGFPENINWPAAPN